MSKTDNTVLKDMIITMLLYGIIVQIVCLIIPGDHLRMTAGLWIGVAAGVFMVIHMKNSLDEAVLYGEQEAQSIGVILEENAELQKILGNPRVMREDKEQMIETIFRGRVSNEIVELMKLMIEKGRYSKIDSVFEYFIGLVKEEKKIGIAYIATAIELSEAQKEAVMQRLLQTTKYESFEMNYQVDASLIGGMVIRIGDRVVDTSIKTKLYELSKSLKKIQV